MSKYNYGVEGSWSQRTKTKDKQIENYKYFIDAFYAADIYYQGKYHKFFSKEILNEEFKIDRLEGNYNAVFSDKYKSIRKELSIKRKVLLYFERYFPVLYYWMKNKINQI